MIKRPSAQRTAAKTFTRFRPMIRSRHETHDILREKESWSLFPFKSVIRFGSETDEPDTRTHGGNRVEINTIQAVRNSSSKMLMKQKFDAAGIQTSDWYMLILGDTMHLRDMQNNGNRVNTDTLHFPLLAKKTFGSRGEGMRKFDNVGQLDTWLHVHASEDSQWIIEQYYAYSKEYRLHVTRNGCFYAIQKKLRNGTPDAEKFYRNDSNSVWICEFSVTGTGANKRLTTQANPAFERPSNWPTIGMAAVNALAAVGLDIGAIDVRVQSNTDNNGRTRTPEFVILETNSAPSFETITAQKYLQVLPDLLKQKFNQR